MYIKKLFKNKIFYCVAMCALGVLFSVSNHANAATLKLSSNLSTLSVGSTATLSVLLNSEGIAVNNSEATIQFSPDLFDVVSISKKNSVFSLWVEEPSFSNSAGIIKFDGGVPTPGFNGAKGTVVSIVVRAKKIGQANFVFSSAAVRANDGLGTDVLSNKQGTSINVTKKEVSPDVVPTVSSSALQITSSTHPNEDQWYKDRAPVFKWVVPSGSDAVQTILSNKISSVPAFTFSPAVSEKSYKDIKDGVWYFRIRARKDGVWGSISTHIVRIDGTAPQKKDVVFAYDNNTNTLNISADVQDVTSGIDHYEIMINGVLIKNISSKEFIDGNYKLPFNNSGNSVVKLTAFDRASNSVEALGTFETTGVPSITLDSITSIVSVQEKLFISGHTHSSGADIVINIKHEQDEPLIIKTKSDYNNAFLVALPALKTGQYDIWADMAVGTNSLSSSHLYTDATSRLLVKIGSFTMSAISFFIAIFIILILLTLGAWYLGYHYGRFHHKLKMRNALAKEDNLRVLFMLKKRLERHLEILHHTRHGRILTKEEKEIKEAIENDLDEIDKIIEEQKIKKVI